MEYIGVPKNKFCDVLGWVNIGDKRYVIVKCAGNYYRADFIKSVSKEIRTTQFPDSKRVVFS